jgi:hypothetical protein
VEVHDQLLGEGIATSLRYFPTAPIKKNYELFPKGTAVSDTDAARLLLGESIPS